MLSCTMSPPQDPAAEARMKVACITEQVLTLVNKRIGLYRHFDETINRYKQSRDVSTLNSGKKSLETEHKALTSEIALLQSRLKTEGSDLCDKVSVCHAGVTWLSAHLVTLPGIVPHLLEHRGAALCRAHTRHLPLTAGWSCGANPHSGTRSLGVSVVGWDRKALLASTSLSVHMAGMENGCFLCWRPAWARLQAARVC